MKNSNDLDDAALRCPIEQEMAAPTAMSGNVERAKSDQNLVTSAGGDNIGATGKLPNRRNQCIAVDARLPSAKILGGPFEDVGEVELRDDTETDPPFRLGHRGYSFVRETTLSESSLR